MAKQWVDITTIDNNTPFMRVRWKGMFYDTYADSWFAEEPGLVTDGWGWQSGTKDYGWYSAHRMNGGYYSPVYCCSFDFDRTASGFWDVSGQDYQVSLKDGNRTQFYDTTVQISGETYYEVDFSLWSGATGYQLYAPYSTMPWAPGDIFVEVGTDAITLDKESVTFKSTGGTNTVTVTAEDDWSAVVSDNWITASTVSGTSGTTTVTISTPDYQGLSARTGSVAFTCCGMTKTLTVKQSKHSTSMSDLYMGALNMEAAYFGALEVEAIYLGENQVYQSGPFQGLQVKPSTLQFEYTGGTNTIKVKSSEPWYLSYDIANVQCNPWSGNSDETIVTVTASDNTGNTDITTVISASTNNSAYTASTEVTIKWNDPFPSVPYMFNYNAKEFDSNTNTFPKKQGQLFNEDLVLDSAPTRVASTYIQFTGSTASMSKVYNTSADNPFNRDSQHNELTIIYKVGNFRLPSDYNLIANRAGGDYNYMVRSEKFHTNDSNFLEMTPSGSTNYMLIRVQSDGSCERTQLNRSGDTIQSVTSSSINWGVPSSQFNFFNGGTDGDEYFNGNFYWMYLSNNALSDADVLKVIQYNDGL